MFKKDFGRLIASMIIAYTLISFPLQAFCERVQVFDVHKNLPMTAKDPVYHDYYISAGRDSGLKEGMIVPVLRATTVHDPLYNVSRGEISIRVGQLKIIQVGERVSVARIYKNHDRAAAPVLDVDAILVGDTVDISDAYVEKSNGKSAANGGEEGEQEGEQTDAKAEANPEPKQQTPSVTPKPVPVQPEPQASNKSKSIRKVASPEQATPVSTRLL
jgi:hypothetical protein